MADWLGTRTGRFIFRKVKWGTWEEAGEYGNVTGGSLELAAFTDIKASGSIDFDGEAPDAEDLLRVCYELTDERGDYEMVPVATMLVECSKPTLTGDSRFRVSQSGSATLNSVLKVLKDKEYGAPFTIPAGTQAVAKAVELTESLGLRVNNPDPSAYALSGDHTFSADDANYLAIVNWLLSAAGYSSAWIDEYGSVQMTPYIEPTERSVSMSFSEGDESVMLPKVPYKNDWQATPNVCRLYYETETESLRAASYNVDAEHPASLPRRGNREKTIRETVSELAGDTLSDRLENLKEMSRKKLIDNSAEIDYVEIGCPYLPLTPNMAVEVRYATLDWRGNVTNFAIDLGDDSNCKLEARRFVRTAIATETEGEVIWSG